MVYLRITGKHKSLKNAIFCENCERYNFPHNSTLSTIFTLLKTYHSTIHFQLAKKDVPKRCPKLQIFFIVLFGFVHLNTPSLVRGPYLHCV